MKSPVKIFVEGEADERFISQLMEHLLNEKVDKNVIVRTEGWNNLVSASTEGTYLNQMRNVSANNGINLIIFDADDKPEHRRADLIAWKAKHNLDFELFLMPDNSSNGELEDLLERIIKEDNQPVMDCWTGYEKSLGQVILPWRNGTPLTTPAKKTKIYAYLEALLGKSKSQKKLIKESNRDYLNTDHWNLCADALVPLSNFLTSNL